MGRGGNWVDRIVTSVPQDRVAARVRSERKNAPPEHSPPKQESPDPNNPHWNGIPTDEIIPVPPGIPNLIGKRMGFLKVVGLYRYRNRKGRRRWVVACKCGAYEIRLQRTLCSLKNIDDKCTACRHEEHKRNRPEKFRTPEMRPTDNGMLGMPPPREFPVGGSRKPAEMIELLKVNETLRKRLKKAEAERNVLVSQVDKARSAVDKHINERLLLPNSKSADAKFLDRLSKRLLSLKGVNDG